MIEAGPIAALFTFLTIGIVLAYSRHCNNQYNKGYKNGVLDRDRYLRERAGK